MSDARSSAVEQLEELIARTVQQAFRQQQAPAVGSAPANMLGLPQPMPAMQPAGMIHPGAVPQLSGVSVPVTVPLPDGREVSVRVHFGADAATNLPNLVMICAQMFGSYLQARNPYRGGGFGYGGYRSNGRYEGGWRR